MLTDEDRIALMQAAHKADMAGCACESVWEVAEAIVARHRIDALETAQRALAGEDTVEWAREAKGSHLSFPLAIGILDDLIEDYADASP